MKPKNAKKIKYDAVRMCKQLCLFTDERVDRKSIPAGLYAYDTRHESDNWVNPVTIEKGIVVVDFCGTVISKEPIEMTSVDFRKPDEFVWRPINKRNYKFLTNSEPYTLKDFIDNKIDIAKNG